MLEKIKKVFTFWKQREKPKVIWWSTIDGLEKVVPVLPAKEVIPDWWKKVDRMKEHYKFKGSVKACPSFPEYVSQGFVVPLWTDLRIEITHDTYKWDTPDKMFQFSSHPNTQFKSWLPKWQQDNTSFVLKPNCPWRIKTPPGWSVWQLPMYYHYDPIFETLPGIIWSDVHHEINQQMMFRRYGTFELKRGTPLAMYVPYERNKYTYDVQGPTEENTRWTNAAYLHIKSKFRGGYQLNQARVKKCPVKH